MTSLEAENLRVVREYIAAVESAATGDALARFYTPDALQIELPSRLNPNGGQSDLATLLKRAQQVPPLLKSQTYTVHSELAQGSVVAIEATWEGVLAIPFGSVPAGASMRAHFAIFFELRDGKIHRQRNYDCFEPW
jgi:ketosteroid isomerase-like protein